MSYTVVQIRAITREFARNAKDQTEYRDLVVDSAVQGILDDFLKHTHCVWAVSDVALTAASSSFTVSATGFHPEKKLAVYIPSYVPALDEIDYTEIIRHQVCNPSSSGKPCKIGFSTATTGDVFPTPDINYTMKIRWWQPWIAYSGNTPISWVPGDSGANACTLNVPDEYIRRVLQTGGPALLQHNQPEQKYAGAAFAAYREYRDSMSGAGNFGAKSIQRVSVDRLRSGDRWG